METEFQNAIGKSTGEVIRDIADFLNYPCVIHPERNLDLRQILPDLNMNEQFSFALLSEAEAQGRGLAATESFYRHTCTSIMGALAERANTITYELLCLVTARIPRVYEGGDSL